MRLNLLICIVGLFLLPTFIYFFLVLVWAPIRIYRKTTVIPKRLDRPAEQDDMTPEAVEFISDMLRQFNQIGFEVVRNRFVDGSVKNVVANSLLLVNQNTRDTAQIIATRASFHRNLVVAVKSEFADHSRTITAFNPGIGFLPKNPEVDALVVSWNKSPKAIFELHQRRLAKAGKQNSEKILQADIGEDSYDERSSEREYAHFVSSGYYQRDRSGTKLRFTARGAFMTAWKMSPPFKRWRIATRDRKARKIWNELDMPFWVGRQEDNEPQTVQVSLAVANEIAPNPAINYETQLGSGEIRQREGNGVLEILAGNERVGQTIFSRSFNIGWLLLTLLATVVLGQRYWAAYKFAASFPPQVRTLIQPQFPWSILLLCVNAIFPILNLTRRFKNAGKVTCVQVSTRGISYKHAIGKRSDGDVSRENIKSIYVFGNFLSFKKKRFTLSLATQKGLVPLFEGFDKATLLNVRKAMAVALGITSDRAL